MFEKAWHASSHAHPLHPTLTWKGWEHLEHPAHRNKYTPSHTEGQRAPHTVEGPKRTDSPDCSLNCSDPTCPKKLLAGEGRPSSKENNRNCSQAAPQNLHGVSKLHAAIRRKAPRPRCCLAEPWPPRREVRMRVRLRAQHGAESARAARARRRGVATSEVDHARQKRMQPRDTPHCHT